MPQAEGIDMTAGNAESAAVALHRLLERDTGNEVRGDGNGMPPQHVPLLPYLNLLTHR
jgi:hypothetical protein